MKLTAAFARWSFRAKAAVNQGTFAIRIPGLLAICLAAAACCAYAAENDTYLSWLSREETLLARAREASARSSGASVGPLAAAESLARRPGKDLNPEDTAWLADDCRRILTAKPAGRASLFAQLTKRLAAYRTVVQGAPPAGADPGQARSTLRRILAGREFAWWPVKSSWWSRMQRQIGDWIGRALSYLFSSGIIYWALIAAGALAAAGILVLIVGTLRGRPPAVGDERPDIEEKAGPGRKAQKQDLSRLAEEAYGLGRYREALRLLYVALLQELDRAGAIRLLKHKTNWDYRREIERSRQDLGQAFGPFTELYEAKWYGRESCAAEHYLEARRLYEAAKEVAR